MMRGQRMDVGGRAHFDRFIRRRRRVSLLRRPGGWVTTLALLICFDAAYRYSAQYWALEEARLTPRSAMEIQPDVDSAAKTGREQVPEVEGQLHPGLPALADSDPVLEAALGNLFGT